MSCSWENGRPSLNPLIFALAVLLMCASGMASAQQVLSSTCIQSPDPGTPQHAALNARAATIDQNGNIYVVGGTETALGANPTGGFVTKVDSSENVVFTKFFPATNTFLTVAVDDAGSIYAAGYSLIVKLDANGNSLLSTILPTDIGAILKLVVDSSHNVIAVGTTSNRSYPTTAGAIQPVIHSPDSSADGFITKLDPTLSNFIFSTYLGGSTGNDSITSAWVAGDDSIFITGSGFSQDFPLTQPSSIGSGGFIAHLSAGGSLILSEFDPALVNPAAMAMDAAENLYVAGSNTGSAINSSTTTTVSKFTNTGTLVYSSQLIGGGASDVFVDSDGTAYVAGSTLSNDLATFDPFQGSLRSSPDAFFFRLSADGSSSLFSTYYGGYSTDFAVGIFADGIHNVYIIGSTEPLTVDTLPPISFPQTGQQIQSCSSGGAIFYLKVQNLNGAPGPIANLNPGGTVLFSSGQPIHSTSSPISVVLRNTGQLPLSVSNVAAHGDFAQSNNCSSVAPGSSCTINVSFTPTGAGSRIGTLQINDNAPDSSQKIYLFGTGLAPTFAANPNSVDFGAQLVGSASAPKTITITNSGNTPLIVTTIVVSGAFTETNDCGSVQPQGSCSVKIVFTPQTSGIATGTVTLTDNALDSPQTFSVTGNGAVASLTVAAGGSSTQTIAAGQTASYALVLSTAANVSGTATLSCMGSPATTSCVVTPQSTNLTSGGTTPVSVTVTTTARSVSALFLSTDTHATFACFLGFPFVLLAGNRRYRRAMFLVLILALLQLSCGGGTSNPSTNPTTSSGTQVGTYQLTITATLPTTTQSTNLTLVVN